MPFNGSGGFVPLPPPTFPAVGGTTILSDQLNLNLNDIFLGFANCVTRDGQSPATANLPMGNNKHTGAAAATAAGQYLVYAQASAVLGDLNVTGTFTVAGAVPYVLKAGDTMTGNLTVPALLPSGAAVPSNGLYLPAANTVGIASNSALRWSVNSAGNHVFATPSSGAAIAVSGIGNATILSVSDGTRTIGLGTDTAAGTVFVGGIAHGTDILANGATRVKVTSAGTFVVDGTAPKLGLQVGTTERFYLQYTEATSVTRIDGDGAIELAPNNTTRLTLGIAGNITAAAPTGGVTLNANGNAEILRLTTTTARGSGNNYLQFQDPTGAKGYLGYGSGASDIMSLAQLLNANLEVYTNNVLRFTYFADGRVAGRGLHNNGAVTGTTEQYIASGTYTPTLTSVANVSSPASSAGCSWLRVGNVVTVSGRVSCTETSVSSLCRLGVSLPIASDITSIQQCCGGGGMLPPSGNVQGLYTIGDTANDRAEVQWIASGSATVAALSFTFTYTIA